MNTKDMLDAIERKIQDTSYDRQTMLLPMLNEALLHVAFRHPLSLLEEKASVVSIPGQEWVEMPDDYHSFLFHAYNQTTNSPCRVCYTRQTLNRMYSNEPTQTGSIESVVVEADKLFYKRIPETPQTLIIDYYISPEELTDDMGSAPECIPAALHHKLLVDQVLLNVYSEIEDGVDGQKVNTLYHQREFDYGMELLRRYMPDVSRPRHYFPRTARTF